MVQPDGGGDGHAHAQKRAEPSPGTPPSVLPPSVADMNSTMTDDSIRVVCVWTAHCMYPRVSIRIPVLRNMYVCVCVSVVAAIGRDLISGHIWHLRSGVCWAVVGRLT